MRKRYISLSLSWNYLVDREFGDKGEVFVAGSLVFVSISAASGEAYLTTTIQPGDTSKYPGKILKRETLTLKLELDC